MTWKFVLFLKIHSFIYLFTQGSLCVCVCLCVEQDVEQIVQRALSLYRADGIGMADYALESSGMMAHGSIKHAAVCLEAFLLF